MKRLLLIIFVLIGSNLFAQEVLDKIVAVVDNEIILKSDLDSRAIYEAQNKNVDPNDPIFRRQILNQMIDQKLLYAQAQIDTLKVEDQEVEREVDFRINSLISQYGSRENLEKAYNGPLDKLKKFLKEEYIKSYTTSRLVEKKFGRVSVNSEEVKAFYERFKDSLGVVNEKYTIAHIFVNPKTGDRIQKKAKELALAILDSLRNGADFAVMAKRYSADPSAASGGDLGERKRGVFVPEFEAAAFSLAPNQISDVVKTTFGYHIIQLIERKGDVIHCRHILFQPKSDDKNDLEAIQFLSDLRDSIMQKKNTFDFYARKYSDDKNSAKLGGELGSWESSQMEKQLTEQLVRMKEGDVGFPKRYEFGNNVYGFHLLKLIKKVPQHTANIEIDYEDIKNLTLQKKKSELIADYIKELKSSIYWDIRL